MFYYIHGKLIKTEPNVCIVDTGGIAYKLTVSSNTISAISTKEGTDVTLYTYLSVREDALELMGFESEDELSLFKLLIGISGVGPKAAISILSALTVERIVSAIASGDSKTIATSQGVGPKTAARVVLELKDKVTKLFSVSENSTPGIDGTVKAVSASAPSAASDAIEALTSLGYTKTEATNAVSLCLDSASDTETLIRLALSRLM